MAVKNIVAGLFLILTISSFLSLAQSRADETLTITTYYLSPNGVFKDMEVKDKLAVGNITDSGNTKCDSMQELKTGQVYVGHSILLRNRETLPNSHKPGEIIYNVDFHKIQFYDGAKWINASS